MTMMVGQDNEFNNFQDWTRTLAIYQKRTGVNTDLSKAYCVLGLTGEAGEVADQVKKILREGDLNGERRAKIKMELGDVLWYLARTADEFGFTLREIAMANIVKLEDRRNRDKLKGDGDER